jgi:D-proline reductase (dithiol) PrdB
VSLTARALEEGGLATVIVGSARDIVEECGVPRFVFSDVPLGNPLGAPGDQSTQRATLELALEVVDRARWPRTTVKAPYRWPTNDWRENYMRVDESNRSELAALGDSRRQKQAAARSAT